MSDMPMTKDICVDVYPTFFSIAANPRGYICGGEQNLDELTCALRLPIFDNRGRFVDAIKYYKYTRGQYRFPINALDKCLSIFDRMKKTDDEITVKLEHYPPNLMISSNPQPIPVNMQDGWVDRPEHEPAFKHLLLAKPHITGNDLQTGKGKSYVGAKLTTIYKCPTAIICDGLLDQWTDNYTEKTDISPERIFLIQGIQSIQRLWEIINERPDEVPWVIICSIRTMNRYAAYQEPAYRSMPRLNDLFRALKIGLGIYDEVHLNTHAIVLLMLELCLDRNVVLSATPGRSDKQEQMIFDIVFPRGLIGGAAEYDRYVHSRIHGYELDLHLPSKVFESFGYGYSHIRYESKLLGKSSYVSEFVTELEKNINGEYINRRKAGDGTKCLIFVSTVRMAGEVVKLLKRKFNNLDIRTYLASDPIDNLHDADIIVSTPKSCGVGKDIRRLLTAINTVSLGSEPLYRQMFGRLRKQDDIQCRWIDMINTKVPQQMRHFLSKRGILSKYSKNFTVTGIDRHKGRRA